MSIRYAAEQHNAASGTRDAFSALSDDLEAEGLPPITVVSGDRDPAEQVAFFVGRFRQQATGSGPYGDVRWWDGSAWGYPGGTRWVRWSSAGTVAVPGTGNHEKHRSNDLAWPYNAVTTAHLRAREIAERHNITCDGLSFGEAWHWTHWGALGVIGSPASTGNATPIPREWDEMASKEEIQAVVRAEVAQIASDTAQIRQDTAGLTQRMAEIAAVVDVVRTTVVDYINPRVKELHSFARIKVHVLWARAVGRDPKVGLTPQQVTDFVEAPQEPAES